MRAGRLKWYHRWYLCRVCGFGVRDRILKLALIPQTFLDLWNPARVLLQQAQQLKTNIVVKLVTSILSQGPLPLVGNAFSAFVF